jgi:hypothetical protein
MIVVERRFVTDNPYLSHGWLLIQLPVGLCPFFIGMCVNFCASRSGARKGNVTSVRGASDCALLQVAVAK